jgi:hypothetical protein
MIFMANNSTAQNSQHLMKQVHFWKHFVCDNMILTKRAGWAIEQKNEFILRTAHVR